MYFHNLLLSEGLQFLTCLTFAVNSIPLFETKVTLLASFQFFIDNTPLLKEHGDEICSFLAFAPCSKHRLKIHFAWLGFWGES